MVDWIKWQNETGDWIDFPLEDIYWHSRDHSIALFSRKVPVIIKEKDLYVVNTEDLYNQYKSSGRAVKRLSDCPTSTKPVIDSGFIGEMTQRRGKCQILNG